jgi:gliding motility-associated-like protein
MGWIGLNIFTNAFNRMRQYIFLFFLFLSSGIEAQVDTIRADVSTGCNPLQVRFSIQPQSFGESILTYDWNFGNWTTVSADSIPFVEYILPGSFDVSCTITTTDTTFEITRRNFIHVMNCNDSLLIPNVFSPNDDTYNDFFQIDTDGTAVYSFSVYTRAGTLVYKTESPSIVWDGRSLSGQKMKNGIYFYVIQRNDEIPLNEVKGIVYLFE